MSETAPISARKRKVERNEDWYGDVRVNVGQEKDEARMKLLKRNTRKYRELYKERKKERSIYIV
jgi:hypothetical protein